MERSTSDDRRTRHSDSARNLQSHTVLRGTKKQRHTKEKAEKKNSKMKMLRRSRTSTAAQRRQDASGRLALVLLALVHLAWVHLAQVHLALVHLELVHLALLQVAAVRLGIHQRDIAPGVDVIVAAVAAIAVAVD